MKFVFISNYLQHHQMTFCEEMYAMLKDDFKFIQTQKPPTEYLKNGYHLYENEPFQINSYESKEKYDLAYKLALDSDVAIITYFTEDLVKERLKSNKITFRYSERFFKRKIVSLRGLYCLFNAHMRFKNKTLYMLCASGYTSADANKIGTYKNKCFKWGYFPPFIDKNIDDLINIKNNNKTIVILWCARFLNLKHPEKALKVAEKLKHNGYKFKLQMLGIGPLKEKIETEIKDKQLTDVIDILGVVPNNEVKNYMDKANIFMFTSDFHEGWGAVLNESMNSGCAVVASHAIGSVPFLIDDEKNGLIYKNDDFNDLYFKIEKLINSIELRNELGKNAYYTIKNEWNGRVAAQKLVGLSNKLLNGESSLFYENGVLSKAEIIKNNWYKK